MGDMIPLGALWAWVIAAGIVVVAVMWRWPGLGARIAAMVVFLAAWWLAFDRTESQPFLASVALVFFVLACALIVTSKSRLDRRARRSNRPVAG